jgi:hypothetical protein
MNGWLKDFVPGKFELFIEAAKAVRSDDFVLLLKNEDRLLPHWVR